MTIREGDQCTPTNDQRAALDDSFAFRQLMSGFPTGVTIVTSVTVSNLPVGATCSSLVSVTLSPPTLLVCLKDGQTLDAVVRSGLFAVNLLRTDARATAELFSEPTQDRFAQVRWCHWGVNELPVLNRDAFAFASCRVDRLMRISDHTVVFGRVRQTHHTDADPLLYGLRRYRPWPADEGTT